MPHAPRSTLVVTLAVVTVLLLGCTSAQTGVASNDATSSETELSGSLSIGAAASLEPAFRELTARFTAEHPGVTFENLTFDGSSTLAEQILAGAPFDIFASADQANMARVENEGLAKGNPIAFATSSLEIAVAPGNPLNIQSLSDLTRRGPNGEPPIVVICAPAVPCGVAAHALLDRDSVDLKPASEEQNVTAVLTKLVAGEADAGLVYRSDVLRSGGAAEGIEIPGSIEAAGTYMISPLIDAAYPEAARAFTDYLRTDEAQKLLDELGFGSA